MTRIFLSVTSVVLCLCLHGHAQADTYASSINCCVDWTNPVTWGAAPDSDCYADNANPACGDGRWFVTLEVVPTLNTDITLTGLADGLMTGGVVGGAHTLTVEEQFDWTVGNIGMTGGTLHLVPACVSTLAGGGTGIGATILNEGTMFQNALIRNSGTIINEFGAEWELNLPLSTYFIWDSTGTFINNGLFRKTGPNSTFTQSVNSFHVTSTGELRVEEGEFILSNTGGAPTGLILDGELEVFAGATAVFARTVTFAPTTKVEGAGTVRFSTGNDTTVVQGTWNVTGLTEFSSGDVHFVTPCVTNDFSQCAGTITGDLVINGHGLWSDGIMSNLGTTWVNGDMTIDTSISCGFASPMALNNRTLQLATGSELLVVSGGPQGDNNAIIDIPAGANMTFDTPNDFRAMGASAGGGTIENDGTIEKKGPGNMWLQWAINNRGLVNVTEGHLDLQYTSFIQTDGELRLNDTTIRLVKPGAIDLQGGLLTGSGEISSGNGFDVFFNAGTIAPGLPGAAGWINLINCEASLQPGSVLDLQLGGTVQGDEYDAVTAFREYQLNGELRLSFINGFENSIANTDVFDLAGSDASTLSGVFTNVASGADLQTADGKGVFTIHYGAGSPFPINRVVATNFRPLAICAGDTDASGSVGIHDFLAVLSQWGACPSFCSADIDGSGSVGISDFLAVLTNWGPCP